MLLLGLEAAVSEDLEPERIAIEVCRLAGVADVELEVVPPVDGHEVRVLTHAVSLLGSYEDRPLPRRQHEHPAPGHRERRRQPFHAHANLEQVFDLAARQAAQAATQPIAQAGAVVEMSGVEPEGSSLRRNRKLVTQLLARSAEAPPAAAVSRGLAAAFGFGAI